MIHSHLALVFGLCIGYGIIHHQTLCFKRTFIFVLVCLLRADPRNVDYATSVVELALPYLKTLDDLEGKPGITAKRLQWLKLIFNGDWRSERVVHHCHLGCPCGSRNGYEVKLKATAIYTSFILGTRPPVPALSKWLKCGQTARWFWMASSIHQLLQKGFELLFGLSQHRDASLRSACAELDKELASLVSADETSAAQAAFMLPDLPLPKVIRVRALKATNWLLGEHTLVDLCIAICSTRPSEYFAEWLFAEQKATCLI